MPELSLKEDEIRPVYVVSGGVGSSGEQLVHTALAQFPDSQVPVFRHGRVRKLAQLEQIVDEARQTGGLILHTLVDPELRQGLIEAAKRQGVTAIDAMGPLLDHLEKTLGQTPVNQPGLYRQLHQAYFERVEAIEYTQAHDDGQNQDGWREAEIVLIGVSRTGKTPLSLYLSVLGWKVANIPLILNLDPPVELFKLDAGKVVGLTIEAGQLIAIRQQRQRRLGTVGPSEYIKPEKVYEEIEQARRIIRRSGFHLLEVTDKPIETSAEEIIQLVTRG